MQPFKLPEFYVPHVVRCNPHLDSARLHAKPWAHSVGILNGESHQIWDERSFDAHDYALLCAYIHPEAPIPELNLMTDWNIWAFYVDDYFIHTYKGHHDRPAAKAYLDRILVFMPVDLGPLPAPANPMERALADLWQRTAPEKSTTWRKRIIESTRRLLEAFLWELDNKGKRRISNPIEYIEMRRQVGAALWSADLVEHAMFVEIPERIADTRPMRVLKETFADGVHLRNDIFSYQREVVKQGELTNAVLVIERFLGTDTQQAVELVNDLLTSRLEQFEHTVATELEPLFDEYQLTVQERANVLTYVRGLRDWQSGAHEWRILTSRYHAGQISKQLSGMSGLGTASVQIKKASLRGMTGFKTYQHIPFKKVGPTKIPEFYMPYTTPVSPHLEAARQRSKAWAREMGFVADASLGSTEFVWDEHAFDSSDVAFFCAYAYPNHDLDTLSLDTYWMAWTTYADDYFVEMFGHKNDLEAAKVWRAKIWKLMAVNPEPPAPPPSTPIERGLMDLWLFTTKALPVSAQIEFRRLIDEMFESWVWEIFNRIQNRIPDALDYVDMRRTTGGTYFILFLSPLVQSGRVPIEALRTLTIKQLSNAATDYACWLNDVISYQKEVEFEGEMHTLVLVLQNFLGCDAAQAIEIVNHLITDRMKQFEYIVENELPFLFENFNLDSQAQQLVLNHVADLRLLMYGTRLWHLQVDRYREKETRRSIHYQVGSKPFHFESGSFGTSAAHFTPRQPTVIAAVAPAAGRKPFGVSHLFPSFLEKPSSK